MKPNASKINVGFYPKGTSYGRAGSTQPTNFLGEVSSGGHKNCSPDLGLTARKSTFRQAENNITNIEREYGGKKTPYGNEGIIIGKAGGNEREGQHDTEDFNLPVR